MGMFELPNIYHPGLKDPRHKPTVKTKLNRESKLLTAKVAVVLFNNPVSPQFLGTSEKMAILSGTPPRDVGKSGFQYNFNTVNSFDITGSSTDLKSVFRPTKFTFFAKVKRTLAGTDFRAIFASPMQSASSGWLVTVNVSNKIQFFTHNGSTFENIESASVLPLDTEVWVIVTYDGANKFIYFDEVEEASGTGVLDYLTTNTNAQVGEYSGAKFPGSMSLLGLVHKPWSADQVKSFVREPNQILDPIQPALFPVQGVAGPTIVSVTGVGGAGIVKDGEQDIAFVTSDFADTSSEATITFFSGTAITIATGVDSIGGSGTFNLPNISEFAIDTEGCPLTSTNNIVRCKIQYDVETADLIIAYNPVTGWEVKELTNVANDQGSFTENFPSVVTDESEAYYDTSDFTSISAGGPKLTITAATQADPVVLSVVNSLSDGDVVAVKAVVGMTELNERNFTVRNPTGTTIELEDIQGNAEDGTGHTAYSSAGTVGLAGGIFDTSSETDVLIQFSDKSDDTWKQTTMSITAASGIIPSMNTLSLSLKLGL